jgi:hypothetical protein
MNNQITYEIEDLNGEIIEGKFYEKELQLVYINDYKNIEIKIK